MTDCRKGPWYVYVDRTDDGTAFYVGKGNAGRASHLPRNNKHKHVAKQYGQHREVLYGSHDEDHVFEVERLKIAEFKTYAHDVSVHGNELACNFDPGGRGRKDYTTSEETRQKLRLSSTARKWSEASRKKVSASKLGRPSKLRNRTQPRELVEKRRQAMKASTVRNYKVPFRKTQFLRDNLEDLVALREQGFSLDDLAEMFNAGRTTIYRYCMQERR